MALPSVAPIEALKAICRAGFRGAPCEADYLADCGVNWTEVWTIAEEQLIPSWCLDFVSRHPQTIEAERLLQWRTIYLQRVASSQAALSLLADLVRTLRAHEIELLALKGSAMLLWLYEDPGLRPLSDIDIYVDELQTLRSFELLKALGYTHDAAEFLRSPQVKYNICLHSGGHMPQLRKGDSFPIEIHLDFLNKAANWEKVKRDIWAMKQTFWAGETAIHCLAPHHAFIHSAIHLVKHLENEKQFAYHWLFDMAMTASRPGQFDWDQLWETAAQWGVYNHVRRALEVVSDFFELKIQLPLPDRNYPLQWQKSSRSETLQSLPTWRLKWRWFWELLVPSPAAMRKWAGLEQCNRRQLMAAYLDLYARRARRWFAPGHKK